MSAANCTICVKCVKNNFGAIPLRPTLLFRCGSVWLVVECAPYFVGLTMLSTANITIQFGAKPLFENVSVKFGDGNRYGLIGANGCGKTTFMKILGGDLEQSSGEVMLDKGERLGKLRQDQFAYEDMRVLDVVMMGHAEMWQAMSECDAIYAHPEASE